MTNATRGSAAAATQRDNLSTAATKMWTEEREGVTATSLYGWVTEGLVVVENEPSIIFATAAELARGDVHKNPLGVHVKDGTGE